MPLYIGRESEEFSALIVNKKSILFFKKNFNFSDLIEKYGVYNNHINQLVAGAFLYTNKLMHIVCASV